MTKNKIDGLAAFAEPVRELINQQAIAFLTPHRAFGNPDYADDIFGIRRQFGEGWRSHHIARANETVLTP